MAEAINHAVLVLEADVDDTEGKETGVFEMVGNLEIDHSIRPNYIVTQGGGSTANGIVSGFTDKLGELAGTTSAGEITNRSGYHIDLGGGRHRFDINFKGWEGATDGLGNPVQWGNTGDPNTLTMGDATGAGATDQAEVFMEYMRIGEYDSRENSAQLYWGHYHNGSPPGTSTNPVEAGLYDDFLQVTVRQANFTRVADDPVAVSGSVILEETNNWTQPIDAAWKVSW